MNGIVMDRTRVADIQKDGQTDRRTEPNIMPPFFFEKAGDNNDS
jgi:hypothetical protein